MDATPFSLGSVAPLDDASASADPARGVDPLARRWVALHQAAALVAALAGEPASPAEHVLALPERLHRGPRWRRELAEQGVEDLAAIMEPGLSALIAVQASGHSPAAPARALWQEFTAARDALLAIAAPLD